MDFKVCMGINIFFWVSSSGHNWIITASNFHTKVILVAMVFNQANIDLIQSISVIDSALNVSFIISCGSITVELTPLLDNIWMCISHVCMSSLVQSMKTYLQWLRIPTCVEWCRGITFDLVCVTMKTAVTDFAFCFVCIASVSAHVGFQVLIFCIPCQWGGL